MKIFKIFILFAVIYIYSTSIVLAEDCKNYNKLSKDYAKCTSEKLKEKTSKKSNELKTLTSEKINEGKKKFNSFKLKEKLLKFKNSKNLKEFIEK